MKSLIIFLFYFILVGCQIKDKNVQAYLFVADSIYSMKTSFETKSNLGISDGNITLGVAKELLDLPDTINLKNYNKSSDTISLFYMANLYLPFPVPIKDTETLLFKLGIYNHHLRENIYRLSILADSRLKAVVNDFGDNIGYKVQAPTGDVISNDYFTIIRVSRKNDNDAYIEYDAFAPKEICLNGCFEYSVNNYNKAFASLVLYSDSLEYSTGITAAFIKYDEKKKNQIHLITPYHSTNSINKSSWDYIIPISLGSEAYKITNKSIGIGLKITLKTKIDITKYGYSHGEYAPFRLVPIL